MTATSTLSESPIDTRADEAAFRSRVSGAGAVVTFHGVTRPLTKQGEPLDRLVLEWHPSMTSKSLQAIAEDGLNRFGVAHVHLVHRCGSILPGETIVFVIVASDHRREAFDVADYLMDRLKTDAVFWKREEGSFGRRWIEPTDKDRNDRSRWSD